MKFSIISITEKGRVLSFDIGDKLCEYDVERYCFYSHSDEKSLPFERLDDIAEKLFYSSDAMIFICACGIAVRTVSRYIESKSTDPAVIVIDDSGKYVIPVLSGHLGGANRIAEIIAERINAVPVITTATDTGKMFSPDSFAKANELLITDMSAAKKIAAAVLENKVIGIYSEYKIINIPPKLSETEKSDYGIVISDRVKKCGFIHPLYLIPKNLVLGIGCRRGTSCEAVEELVRKCLDENEIMFERVKAVATIDIKQNEKGITEFCDKYGFELFFYSAEQLMEISGDFTKSDFVKGVTGSDNVCERSAVLASCGELIMRKCCGNGITCAVAERPVVIDFERKML